MFRVLMDDMIVTEAPAKVRFKNGKIVYGTIVGLLAGEPLPEEMKFIPNPARSIAAGIKNRSGAFCLLTADIIDDIDACLK